MKLCKKCQTYLPLDWFDKQSRNKDGLRIYCQTCSRKQVKSWRSKNVDKVKENNRLYRENNAEQARLAHDEWRKKNPDILRAKNLRKYWPHLTAKEAQAEYDKLLVEQDECCATCLTHRSEYKKALSVDHNHLTGKVRGLLCNACNIALGQVKDDVDVLNQLIHYLNKHESENTDTKHY